MLNLFSTTLTSAAIFLHEVNCDWRTWAVSIVLNKLFAFISEGRSLTFNAFSLIMCLHFITTFWQVNLEMKLLSFFKPPSHVGMWSWSRSFTNIQVSGLSLVHDTNCWMLTVILSNQPDMLSFIFYLKKNGNTFSKSLSKIFYIQSQIIIDQMDSLLTPIDPPIIVPAA